MILRELLYKGPKAPHSGGYPQYLQDAIKIFIKFFIKNELLFIKIIKNIIYGDAFYWFILLIKLTNY